jgi:hypothetical protein
MTLPADLVESVNLSHAKDVYCRSFVSIVFASDPVQYVKSLRISKIGQPLQPLHGLLICIPPVSRHRRDRLPTGRRRIVDSVATFESESTVFKPQFSTENFVYALGITARIDETQNHNTAVCRLNDFSIRGL